MSKGRLSNTEKYAIQGMLHERKPVAEIAKALGRTEKTVSKYIDGELDDLIDTITRVRATAEVVEEPEDEVDEVVEVVKKPRETKGDVIADAKERLALTGMSKKDVEELLNTALSLAKKDGIVFRSGKELYQAAMKRINAKHLMARKAAGGREGVTVMTKAATERIDDKKFPNQVDKNAPFRKGGRYSGSIFRPNTGTIDGEDG